MSLTEGIPAEKPITVAQTQPGEVPDPNNGETFQPMEVDNSGTIQSPARTQTVPDQRDPDGLRIVGTVDFKLGDGSTVSAVVKDHPDNHGVDVEGEVLLEIQATDAIKAFFRLDNAGTSVQHLDSGIKAQLTDNDTIVLTVENIGVPTGGPSGRVDYQRQVTDDFSFQLTADEISPNRDEIVEANFKIEW